MNLPENFYFSPNNLQDYLDCPRRFELRHILKQAWPAIRSEPIRQIEKQMQMGNQFHLFIQQFFNQIPAEKIKSQTTDPMLLVWWDKFFNFSHRLKGHQNYAELRLTCQLDQFRFIGVIDLLSISPNGEFTIFDWKTNRKKPSKMILQQKIQTILYPLLIFKNKQRFPKQEASNNEINMEYWFVNAPDTTVLFHFSNKDVEEAEQTLFDLANIIKQTESGNFHKTDDESKCKFCNYRSLCARGVSAGLDESEEHLELEERMIDFDLENLAELEF